MKLIVIIIILALVGYGMAVMAGAASGTPIDMGLNLVQMVLIGK